MILASCCCDRLLPLVCLVTDCVMLRDVSALTERDHFQRLKPCVLLSSSHKDFVWLQKTWNATRLVCNAFILLVYGQFLQQIPVTALIFACYMFYIVQRWVGLG